MTLLDAPVSRKLPAEVLTADEVAALMRACSADSATGIRNRAMIGTLYRAGLRIGEALALFPKDLDRQSGTIRVLHGKGDKARTVGMDPGAFAVLDCWLHVRGRFADGRCPVFCTLEGGKMADAYVRALLPRLAKRAGIHKRVHAHGMRHTFASELAGEGVELVTISQMLGHSSLATTSHYIRQLNPQRAIETIRARAWNLES